MSARESHFELPDCPGAIGWPTPIAYFRHIFSVLADIGGVFRKLGFNPGNEVPRFIGQPRNAPYHGKGQMKAIEFIQHRHVERGRCRALLPETVHMKVVVVCPTICEVGE